MTMSEAEAMAKLNEIANRLEVIAIEYVGRTAPNVSRAVFEEAQKRLESLMKTIDKTEMTGASLWRTRSISQPDLWLVIVCQDVGCNLWARVTWGEGQLHELDERFRRALIERHLHQMLAEWDEETGTSKYLAHYGLGAELRRGGDLRLRIGGEG